MDLVNMGLALPSLLMLVVPFALGGIPECSTVVHSECELLVDPAFGNAVAKQFDGKWAEVKNNREMNDALCDAENWKKRSEVCGPCPLNLVVTEPPSLRMTLCLADNDHTPYAPNMHMHLAHPLNGKEMELKTFKGTGWGDFCRKENWANGTDSIALTFHGWGACQGGDEESLLSAAQSGFPIVIEKTNLLFSGLVWGDPLPPYHTQNRPVSVGYTRTSTGLEDTLVFKAAPTAGFGKVIDALGAGTVVKGMVTFSCATQTAYEKGTVDTTEYYTDGCPWRELQGADMCDYRSADADRLCSRCPVELKNTTGGVVGCLYGPDMIPSRRELFFEGAFGDSLPFTEKVLYVDSWMFPSAACKASGWPEEFKGRIVAYEQQDAYWGQGCDWVDPIVAAQEAGVKGLIFLNPSVPGLSAGLRIPVGSVSQHVSEFRAHATKGNSTEVGGHTVYETELWFASGVLEPHPQTPPPPVDPLSTPIDEETADVLQEAGAMAGVVLIPLLGIAVAAKVVHGTRAKDGMMPGASGVPLALSSTALSLTLLLVVAAVSFSLAYDAGQKGVETASDDGEEAVSTTNSRNIENVRALTAMLMNDVINGVANTYTQWKEYLHFKAKMVSSIMEPDSETPDFLRFYRVQTLQFNKVDHIDSEHMLQSFFTSGFYYDQEHFSNDYRSEYSINGTLVGNISVTNNGWLYHFRGTSGPATPVPRTMWDPFQGVATSPLPKGYDTVLDYMKARDSTLAVRDGVFHVSSVSKDFTNKLVSSSDTVDTSKRGPYYSILEPITYKTFRGVAVASAPCSQLSEKLQAVVESERNKLKIAQNMSLVMFTEDGVIIASNDDLYELTEVYYDVPNFGYRLFTVFDTRTVQVNALAHVLLEKFGALDVRHVNDTQATSLVSEKVVVDFDQSEYYKGPPSALLRLSFEGNAQDVSGSNWDTRVEGCTSGCFVKDEGRSCMRFDGLTRVAVLPYLTTRVDHVKATATGGTGGWSSSRSYYNQTLTRDGVGDVIGHSRFTGQTTNIVVLPLPVYRNPFYYHEPFSLSVYLKPTRTVDVPEEVRPRIVGDTRVGDGAFRWYADGQLKVSVVQFGCVTAALELPTDRWTFLVAAVNFRERYCAVYRDGVEVSRGGMAYSAKPLFTREGLSVGDHYEGLMADFRVHNRTLVAADVRQLMATGDGVAAPSRQWTASVDVIRSPGNQRLLVAAMVPTEDVVRDVEANNRRTEERLRTHRRNTETKLDRKLAEAVLVAVVVALVAALLFLLFNDLLTGPFRTFAHDLYLTSRMDVDGIDTSRRKSCVKEINVMQQAMQVMVSNIREYKSFMPMSLMEKIDTCGSSESEDSTFPEETSDLPLGSRRSQKSPSRDSSSSKVSSKQPVTQDATHLTTLQKKKVSFVMVNIVGWHGMTETMNDAQIFSTHGNYVGTCVAAAVKHRGVPEPFLGDRLLATFNGVKNLSSHPLAACSMALELKSANWQMTVSVALTCGRCRVGNMGTSTMRKFTFLGAIVPWTYALERYCARNEFTNVADKEISDAAVGSFAVRHLGAVSYTKHTSRLVRVSEVVHPISVCDEEWMYQLEGKASVYADWNALIESIVRSNWEDAIPLVDKVSDDPDYSVIRPMVMAAVQNKDYRPEQLEN